MTCSDKVIIQIISRLFQEFIVEGQMSKSRIILLCERFMKRFENSISLKPEISRSTINVFVRSNDWVGCP